MTSSKIDTTIGNKYMEDVCDKCKDKIVARTKRIGKWAMLNPLSLAKSFQSVICNDCKKKIIKKMKNNG